MRVSIANLYTYIPSCVFKTVHFIIAYYASYLASINSIFLYINSKREIRVYDENDWNSFFAYLGIIIQIAILYSGEYLL
jgi:peptidoglycan biosynthesis protein MviN/MurJ (putative lipid II flippase)